MLLSIVFCLLVVTNLYKFLTRGWTFVLIQPQKCKLWLVIFGKGEYNAPVRHVTYQFNYFAIECHLHVAFFTAIFPALLRPPYLLHWPRVRSLCAKKTVIKRNHLSKNGLNCDLVIPSLGFCTHRGMDLDGFMQLNHWAHM